MTVFSLYSPDHAASEVVLLVESPFDFDRAHAGAARLEVAPGVGATFVGLRDLVAMKRRAGRPQDLQDAKALDALDPRTDRQRDG